MYPDIQVPSHIWYLDNFRDIFQRQCLNLAFCFGNIYCLLCQTIIMEFLVFSILPILAKLFDGIFSKFRVPNKQRNPWRNVPSDIRHSGIFYKILRVPFKRWRAFLLTLDTLVFIFSFSFVVLKMKNSSTLANEVNKENWKKFYQTHFS